MSNLRLQRFLAEAGVASRRASEQIILAGRVTVDGRVVREMGIRVDPSSQTIAVDGQPIKVRRKLYVALNKPAGFICSRRDEAGRRTVYDLLPREWNNLVTVGRLDQDSEGLLFLTNDGDFTLRLTHPRFGVIKTYVVTVEGKVQEHSRQRFLAGIMHEGESLRAAKVRIVSANRSQSVVELELTEGKNREVRRLFETEGMAVRRLQRVRIGKIKLGELPSGKWRTLTEPEIKSLLAPL